MTKDELKKNITKAPSGPGLYFFTDKKGQYLYVGKALNIKSRLKNYLLTQDSRIKKMIMESSRLNFKPTQTDIEALILESQAIKKSRPFFNIVMRDDKQYFYIEFDNDKFQRIKITHQPSKYNQSIGPFTDGTSLKSTLRYLRKIFPYCTCKEKHNNFCLNYHIGKCLGFCCLKNVGATKEETLKYSRNINSIKEIFSGNRKNIIRNLTKEMKKMAKEKIFEEAIRIKSQIEKIENVFRNADVINKLSHDQSPKNLDRTLIHMKKELNLDRVPKRIEGFDVSNIQGQNSVGSMVVFENGTPNKNRYRKFKIKNIRSLGDTGMLREVMTRRFNHPEWPYPNLIIVDGGKGQFNIARSLVPKNVDLIAMVKDKKHRGIKIIIDQGKKKELLSKLSADTRNIILNVDSEAHRFAINFYRHTHRRGIRN